MIVERVATAPDTVSATLSSRSGERRIDFRRLDGRVAGTTDVLVAPSVMLGMATAEDVVIHAPTSARLLSSTTTVQDIFAGWFPQLSRVRVTAEPVLRTGSRPADGVGTFFSGGVDSFYTALKHATEITHLVVVHGFDVALDRPRKREQLRQAARTAARELGATVIEVETNAREVLTPPLRFGKHAHGAILAGVAHLLAPTVRRVYVASTHDDANLVPRGSHPLVDHLWSSDVVEVVHDGCEATRVQKLAAIAGHHAVRSTLRVCLAEDYDGDGNCGRCGKCLTTMVGLRAVGALDDVRTFDRPLDLDVVGGSSIDSSTGRRFAEENLRAAEEAGDRELADALARALALSAQVVAS